MNSPNTAPAPCVEAQAAPPVVAGARLGVQHFAHLRAVAEGLDVTECARRYLGIHHGLQAMAAHMEVVKAVQAVARRRQEKAWRLLGLAVPVPAEPQQPTLEAFGATTSWAAEFSEAELLAAYEAHYPVNKKRGRRRQLRETLLTTLDRLEKLAAEQPSPTDALAGWFDDETAARLSAIGLQTLGQLNARIASDPAWFAKAAAIGVTKAERIAAHLASLIPPPPTSRPGSIVDSEEDALAVRLEGALDAQPSLRPPPVPSSALSVQVGPHRFDYLNLDDGAAPMADPLPGESVLLEPAIRGAPGPTSMLSAKTDAEAVYEWIGGVAGSRLTALSYLREARRLILWLRCHRQPLNLAGMKVADCTKYKEFLSDIPPPFVNRNSKIRVRAKPGTPLWKPFRDQLTQASQRQAIVIVASMFEWLARAEYLQRNPWAVVNKKQLESTRDAPKPTSKAIGEDAFEVILRFVEEQPSSASRTRFRFILLFLESVGLRSAELIRATVGDLRKTPEGWILSVEGKGAKRRDATLPAQAVEALEDYLSSRGLESMNCAPSDAPLLGNARGENMKHIGYQALYAHVKKWLTSAMKSSELDARDREALRGASTHWLRHTFGTRAMARGVPVDVIQAQMGHGTTKTTTDIYGRAPEKRRVEEMAKAFGVKS